jgi:HK97 gp10 family phage protein
MAKEKVIEGFDRFDKQLAALSNPRDARKVLRSAMNTALTPVINSARQNVPKGTAGHTTYNGRLVSGGFASRSIKKNVKVMGDAIVGRVGVQKEAFYALFFETGTRHLTKKPWLEPALEDNEKKVIQRFGDGIEKWIKKIAAKR